MYNIHEKNKQTGLLFQKAALFLVILICGFSIQGCNRNPFGMEEDAVDFLGQETVYFTPVKSENAGSPLAVSPEIFLQEDSPSYPFLDYADDLITKVSVSSDVSPYIAENMLDNDYSTVWGSREDTVEIVIDLKGRRIVYGLGIDWYNNYYASEFMISTETTVNKIEERIDFETTFKANKFNESTNLYTGINKPIVAEKIIITLKKKSGITDAYAIRKLKLYGYKYGAYNSSKEVLGFGLRSSLFGLETGFNKDGDNPPYYYETVNYKYPMPEADNLINNVLSKMQPNYKLGTRPTLFWGIVECNYTADGSPDTERRARVTFNEPITKPENFPTTDELGNAKILFGEAWDGNALKTWPSSNHDTYLKAFGSSVDVYLAIEPSGDKNNTRHQVNTLIKAVLSVYGGEACIKGVLIDNEYLGHNGESAPEGANAYPDYYNVKMTAADLKKWRETIDVFEEHFKKPLDLWVKHWEVDVNATGAEGELNYEPKPQSDPAAWEGVTFVCDNQDNGSWRKYNTSMLDWADDVYPQDVFYQIGYASDWLVVNNKDGEPHDPVFDHKPWFVTLDPGWEQQAEKLNPSYAANSPDNIPESEYTKMHNTLKDVLMSSTELQHPDQKVGIMWVDFTAQRMFPLQ